MIVLSVGATGQRSARYGQGTGPILLDKVCCSGNELSILNCPQNPIVQHNCSHFDDAGEYYTTGTLGGAISLYSLSVLKVSSVNVTLWLTSNKAQKGGAIFIQDSIYAQAHGMRKPAIVIIGNSTQAKLKFDRNTATVGGYNIYGGWIGWSFSNGTVAYTDQVSN